MIFRLKAYASSKWLQEARPTWGQCHGRSWRPWIQPIGITIVQKRAEDRLFLGLNKLYTKFHSISDPKNQEKGSLVDYRSSWQYPDSSWLRCNLTCKVPMTVQLQLLRAGVGPMLSCSGMTTQRTAMLVMSEQRRPYMAEDGEYFCNFQQGVSLGLDKLL